MRLFMEDTEHNVTDNGVLVPSHVKVFVGPGPLQRQRVVGLAPGILKALVFDFLDRLVDHTSASVQR